ncbi:acyl-CoA dehydrogenase [Sphingobium sp. PNB]|uniref:acyl-CoA dehydrogenase family protein n=1 Tax=Sphingobium sp. PNB TaxID=863934 RepID=UPI001CA430A4|nr:acyl-CoA dehydrogenase family protein [Sphingobium sp. PNB]MCB4859651.1 acyl-CoA dehydrogenase [Sphingobium sp. PNB]
MSLQSAHSDQKHPSVTAAAALRPRLEQRIALGDEIRRLPDDTIADLKDAGLLAALIPAQHGGSEVTLDILFDIVQELGQADGSVAWTYAVLAAGSWMAAGFFSAAASRQLYGSANPSTGAVMTPSKLSAEQVDGGMLIHEAQWSFNSGIHHAGWNVIGIPTFGAHGEPVDLLIGLVPTEQLTIVDDWDTSGLRGSGSCTTVAKDLFVPSERLASYNNLLKDQFPEDRASGAPLYSMAVAPAVVVRFAAPAIAIARGALNKFLQQAPNRRIKLTVYIDQSAAAVTHLQVAEAAAKIDAAETITRRSMAELEAAAAKGQHLTVEQRARIWRDASFASHLAWEATDLLASASGGSFIRTSNPINHAWRDLRALTAHAALNLTTAFEAFGRVRFGLPSNNPMLPA